MSNDDNRELLEEYKELGLQFRHHASEITTTSRLMLPAMVIGLLILYGNVGNLVGVEIKNPTAAYWLIVVGCAIISLMWIANVSRLTQVLNRHAKTLREGEANLELKGGTEIFCMDDKSPTPIILRHRHLRLMGFWIYFSLLLLNVLPRLLLNSVPGPVEALPLYITLPLSLVVVLFSGALTLLIRKIYWAGLPSESDEKSDKFKWKDWLIIAILAVLLISYPVIPQIVPDANAHLMRGLKHYAKGNYEDANEAYKKAIELNPNFAPAYALRGLEHSAKDDDKQSNADWNEAKKHRKEQ